MSEQLTNIMWMTEQLDFDDLTTQDTLQLETTVQTFLESTANPRLAHSVYPA